MVEKHCQNVNDGSEPPSAGEESGMMAEKRSLEGLDKPSSGSKIPPISGKIPLRRSNREIQHPGFMTPTSPSQPPEKSSNMAQCKHPRVQIVAREEDTEFVECLECREIFESSEFKDMAIEETKLRKEDGI